MHLEDLGWDPTLAYHAAAAGDPALVPGRLATVDRGRVIALTETGEVPAAWRFPVPVVSETTGVMPAVGDWGLLTAAGDLRSLVWLLPRRTLLARRVDNGAPVTQPLAANVDLVIVVTGLDGDFSPRRIERYLALARSGDVRALVVLSKRDLVADPEPALAAARRSAPGLTVVAVSSLTGEGLDEVEAEIGPGRTVVLVGSSGAGKSTLINRLLGYDRQRTGAVRESDDRGRHATTRRELLPLPGGGLIIDSPGLREVGILADQESLLVVFPEIATYAEDCRFRDCSHQDEPDCAVTAAVAQGELEAERLASFHRLEREGARARLRENEHERRARERSIFGDYRKIMKAARRFKGQE